MITPMLRGSHAGLNDSHMISRSAESTCRTLHGISSLTSTETPPQFLSWRFLLKLLYPWNRVVPSCSVLSHDSVTAAMSMLLCCSTPSSSSTLLVRQQALVRYTFGMALLAGIGGELLDAGVGEGVVGEGCGLVGEGWGQVAGRWQL